MRLACSHGTYVYVCRAEYTRKKSPWYWPWQSEEEFYEVRARQNMRAKYEKARTQPPSQSREGQDLAAPSRYLEGPSQYSEGPRERTRERTRQYNEGPIGPTKDISSSR